MDTLFSDVLWQENAVFSILVIILSSLPPIIFIIAVSYIHWKCFFFWFWHVYYILSILNIYIRNFSENSSVLVGRGFPYSPSARGAE